MASTMKVWGALVGTGLALVAIWALPVEWRLESGPGFRPAEDIHAQQLAGELRTTTEVYRRIVWADSVLPFVTGPTPPPPGLIVHDGELPEAQRARYEEMVAADVAEIDPVPGVRFASVLLDRTIGRRAEMGSGGFDRTETWVGEENGMPYCIQMRPVRERGGIVHVVANEVARVDNVLPISNSLGPCAFYLRHGLPGEGIEEWLAAGGAALAQERGYEDRPALRVRSRSLLGMRWGDRPFDLDRCYTGDASACASSFLDARARDRVIARNLVIAERSPALWLGYRSGWSAFAIDDGFMLFDLEEEFGRDAFTDFWTSDADVQTAFENAFGIGVGEWLVTWIAKRSELDSRGPALDRAATSGSIAFVFVLLLIALSHQRRRRVVA